MGRNWRRHREYLLASVSVTALMVYHLSWYVRTTRA